MLIILPLIITVCGIFSIVCSVILILVLVVCSNINQKMAVEEKANNSINKQLDIQYSKVPITERAISTTLHRELMSFKSSKGSKGWIKDQEYIGSDVNP